MPTTPRGSAATAPGKVMLFGEHAIERGQPALAAAVGMFARCRVAVQEPPEYLLRSGDQQQQATAEQIQELARTAESHRRKGDFGAMRKLAEDDSFAASKYILGSLFGDALPRGMIVEWESQIPPSAGLGAGSAAFAAMVTAAGALLHKPPTLERRAELAQLGEVLVHGAEASALDAQASVLGGIVRFIGKGLADRVPCAPGLSLVIGDTGVPAPQRQMKSGVQRWIEERPQMRSAYFETVGVLTRTALQVVQRGDWPELGRLMNLNQLVLEKIGVSSPEIERLIDAAWGAGALGAKLSGAGGGGIIIALVSSQTKRAVADAIAAAGGTVYTPDVPAPGARTQSG